MNEKNGRKLKIKIVYTDDLGNHIDTKYTEYESQGNKQIDQKTEHSLAKWIKPVVTWKIHNVYETMDSSTSPCYARFTNKQPIKVMKGGIKINALFIGIDKDGVVTYYCENRGYETAWDCNVYSA